MASLAFMRIIEDTPVRALALGAHPDDAELFAGATMAKWAGAGCRVVLAVATDGGAGGPTPESTRDSVAVLRAREQAAAARKLGVAQVEMLGLRDGELEDTGPLRGEMVRLIRMHRPEIVLTHDPHVWKRFCHRDHRILGTVVQDAVFPYARDRLHYQEHSAAGLAPHKAAELWFWDSDEPDVAVEVGGAIERQAAALAEHRSQLAGVLGGGAPDQFLAERAREAARGSQIELAELFRRLIAPA